MALSERIKETMTAKESWTLKELYDALGGDPATIRGTLNNLTKKGTIKRTAKGVYSL